MYFSTSTLFQVNTINIQKPERRGEARETGTRGGFTSISWLVDCDKQDTHQCGRDMKRSHYR